MDTLRKIKDVIYGNSLSGLPERLLAIFPKFEQVAFYCPDIEKGKLLYQALGCRLDSWTDDIATHKGVVIPEDGVAMEVMNVAQISYNYDIGTELELMRYVAGYNWHQVQSRIDSDGHTFDPMGNRKYGKDKAFLSHMSYHVPSAETEARHLTQAGFRVVQDVRTISHTNPFLVKNGRRFHDIIFDTRDVLGFDIKIMERLEAAAQNAANLGTAGKECL